MKSLGLMHTGRLALVTEAPAFSCSWRAQALLLTSYQTLRVLQLLQMDGAGWYFHLGQDVPRHECPECTLLLVEMGSVGVFN